MSIYLVLYQKQKPDLFIVLLGVLETYFLTLETLNCCEFFQFLNHTKRLVTFVLSLS